jgi:hypothetical protein
MDYSRKIRTPCASEEQGREGQLTMLTQSTKKRKITKILEEETGGKSYRAHKYSLDNDRSTLDYGETDDKTFVWKKRGETDPPTGTGYKCLREDARILASRGEQVLTYFLDGSRHVYKVDDMAYAYGERRVIYPTIAGQIGVGICKRKDKRVIPENGYLVREMVIAVPSVANSARKNGFFDALCLKLNDSAELSRIVRCGWGFSTLVTYDVRTDEKNKFEDRGTAKIQDVMIRREKEMVKRLVSEKKLNQDNYLVKDGSLEYRLTEDDIVKGDPRKFQTFKQNYNWVIGVSKSFNPEACFDKGKSNPGYIADLPPFSRTSVAHFGSEREPLSFAVWYIRIREDVGTRSPFDGIIKVEKILVRDEEVRNGMDTATVDRLSALIINERNPTCYGIDTRWANHIYPIYLTERYVKSQYLSSESFLQLF